MMMTPTNKNSGNEFGEGSSKMSLPMVGTEGGIYDNQGRFIPTKGGQLNLYTQLWLSCAGPLITVPSIGDMVYYYPQGHIEQVVAYMNEDEPAEMPVYNLPAKILCKVAFVKLQVETNTDEVCAQINLLPQREEPTLEDVISQSQPKKTTARSFIKKLTPSDTSTHGGLSIPKRYADECFPQLDMSLQPPSQELVAKDLHGNEWRFRHIYRGQPRRHLITSGWSSFVSTKKLVAGDDCSFLRGENDELYVGIRRATKSRSTASASILSCQSMQHGILSSAFHAISTGCSFTVYHHPWINAAQFMIPYDQYMKSDETDYSIGLRFRMQFESEDSPEHKCRRFSGTVTGIEDLDSIRWPGSEWKRFKVEWDAASDILVFPERVSPWSIEPMGTTKKKCKSILPVHPKRARTLDPSIPFLVDGASSTAMMKNASEYMPRRHLGVLQGQEISTAGACEQHSSAQPTTSLQPTLQPFPGCSSMQVGSEKQLPFQDLQASRKEKGVLATPQAAHSNSYSKCMLFGVNITSQSCVSDTNHAYEPPEDIHSNLREKQFQNCFCSSSRTCTKVLKHGTAIGRSVELARFDGYNELIYELDKRFEFRGTLTDGSAGWHVTYTDGEGDMMLLGDCSWLEFRLTVRKMFICPKEEVDKPNPNTPN